MKSRKDILKEKLAEIDDLIDLYEHHLNDIKNERNKIIFKLKEEESKDE